jgi:hypothetical protein|tara:strand:- start:1405 stop:1608 length:204 start_codon:yes stop_codon:yes gene_type:complete
VGAKRLDTREEIIPVIWAVAVRTTAEAVAVLEACSVVFVGLLVCAARVGGVNNAAIAIARTGIIRFI